MYKILTSIALCTVVLLITSDSMAKAPKEIIVKNTIINLINLDETKERAYINNKDNGMWLKYLLNDFSNQEKNIDRKKLFKKPQYFDVDDGTTKKDKFTSCKR